MADRPDFQTNPRKPSASDGTTKKSSSSDPAPSISKFLYKVLVFVGVVIVVPLFPSRAPDFFSQTVFTRGWELVHLLFVGIAVCYGLFSRRNEAEPDKENKFDNAQTVVSRFLQVPSVFDDEVETLDGCGDDESRRVQSWSSQYSRGEPVVVVAADESSGNGERRGMVSSGGIRTRVGDNAKPLLLPVRSLKSRILDSGVVQHHQVDGDALFRRSNSGLNGDSSRALNLNVEDDDNVVLRSPIPWRSRSGRMEMKEEVEGFDLPKLNDEYVFRPVRSEHRKTPSRSSSVSSTPNSLSPSASIDLSPRPPPHSHSVSPELKAKDVEDGLRRKAFNNSSPPPAPPLPPPTYRKSPLIYSSSFKGEGGTGMASSEKEFRRMASEKDVRRSGTSEEKNSSRSVREEMMRRLNSSSERRSVSNVDNGLMVGKSVRTTRSGESLPGRKAAKDIPEVTNENTWKDVMEAPKERIGRKFAGIDPAKPRNEKALNQEMNIPVAPVSRYSDPHKEEKEVSEDIVRVESENGSESEDEDQVSESLNSFRSEEPQSDTHSMADFGPDVDKKADEFIAKFREQIRLQRIESIKRSTYQATRKVT
uniref:Uncharacterized protein n=1 Tax=Kalanchoe fedtschenkoi TaxID=63787 RepID=A0A7N0VJH4_KALFE